MRAEFGGPRRQRGFWNFVIPAIGAVASAMISKRSAKKSTEAQIAAQREFAEQGVQRRVADAKAAGLHPVYALGANTPGFSPTAQFGPSDGGVSEASQHIGRAFEAANERQDRALNRRLIEAQIRAADASSAENLAQAQYWASEAARRNQPGTAAGPGFGSGVIVNAYKPIASPEAHPLDRDAIELKPDARVSRSTVNPAMTAARDHPSMREFVMYNGDRVLLPAGEEGQMPEDMSMIGYLEAIGANVARYGYRSIPDAVGRWMGISPEARRGRTVESALRNFVKWARQGFPRGGPR